MSERYCQSFLNYDIMVSKCGGHKRYPVKNKVKMIIKQTKNKNLVVCKLLLQNCKVDAVVF
jgi:hypothetical protein